MACEIGLLGPELSAFSEIYKKYIVSGNEIHKNNILVL